LWRRRGIESFQTPISAPQAEQVIVCPSARTLNDKSFAAPHAWQVAEKEFKLV
jgi:hypothetical protein